MFRKKFKNKTKKQVPERLEHDLKILYNYASGEFFLCVPMEQNIPPYKKTSTVLSCDPGIKTFQTAYSSNEGNHISLNNRLELLKKLRNKISLIQSEGIKVPYEHYARFNNIIADTQWRFCDYLIKYPEVSLIILPHFESQGMRKKNSPGFNSILLNFNKHYQFGQKLGWKCLKGGIKLLRVNESWTTKTCGLCGKINEHLTLNDRIFNCSDKKCKYKNIDRDYHAARNILIKTLSV